MLLLAMPWTVISILSLIPLCLARPGQIVRATAPKPTYFETVPNCALQCVEAFIKSDYEETACPGAWDLGCLCRTKTASGYTLGEAALRCGLSTCSMEVVLGSKVYSLCDSITGALPRTHATITATVVSTISSEPNPPTSIISGSTSTLNPETETPGQKITTTNSVPTASVTSFQTPVSASITREDSPTTTSDQPASDTAPPSSNRLNAGAVIGVSVASGVSGFFIIGVVLFFCCRKYRRRNQQPKDRNFFEIGGIMSEPPDFSLPPRRPSPTPRKPTPMADAGDTNSDTVRLVSPSPPESADHNPAVVVTRADNDDGSNHRRSFHQGRIGFAYSSTSDLGASPTQSSPRTASDLLPDKPAYGLCPEPLRWSQQKYLNPATGDTMFEEEATSSRGVVGGLYQYPNFSGTTGRYRNGGRPKYGRPPMMGLPANPRAMLYGFGKSHNGMMTPRGWDPRKKPVYANAGEKIQPSRRADIHRLSPIERWEKDVASYWHNPNFGYARGTERPSSRNAQRRSFHDHYTDSNPRDQPVNTFETVDINEDSRSRRACRHSGGFTALSPVREVRTPVGDMQKPAPQNNVHPTPQLGMYPQIPPSRAVSPVQEIVSRPRIVRRDDIKRVEIHRGKPQPPTLTVPYAPDDYWLDPAARTSSDRRRSTDTPFCMPKKKPVPVERNLTPSRLGSDLILRVD